MPAAWRTGDTWRIRRYVTDSHGARDVAEYELDDEEIAAALCQFYDHTSGAQP